jgi:hypothetical protein
MFGPHNFQRRLTGRGSTWTPGSDHRMFNDGDREPWEVIYEPMAKREARSRQQQQQQQQQEVR